jgi:hypothetical protein
MNETTITTRTSSRSGSSWSSARRARTRLLRLDVSTADPEWSGDGTVVEEMDVRPTAHNGHPPPTQRVRASLLSELS